MKEITHIKGDATKPVGDDNKIIIHCCNDVGAWGAGFVVALSRRWKEPERQYRQWHRSQKGFKLGKVQYVKVEDDIVVCNMIGQRDIRSKGNVSPIRYGAISKCLDKVKEAALKNNASVHCPLFGAGLAGGSWTKIEMALKEELADNGVSVTVYHL
jgi:O-acetyl-ADP-ribose deacetylase (regulator of RNase III)